MNLWLIVIIASLACLSLKLAGYLVPPTVLEKPGPARISNLLTVALLSALVGVQTFGHASTLVLDARAPALLVAIVLFAFRVPFIVVVVLAAVTAALVRLTGWG